MKEISNICKLILCVCLFFAATFGEITFDQWTTENGLPHNTVRQIVQTPDGYLWVTTFDGLVRFDGVRFTNFNSVNTKEITDNRFLDAFVEEDGTLWASMLNGSIVRYRDEKFESFQVIESLTTDTHLNFKTDKENKLLIVFNERGKETSYQFKEGKIVLAADEYQNLNKQYFLSPSGKVWTIMTKGISEDNSGKITDYPLELMIGSGNISRARLDYFEDRNGAFWIGDEENLYKLFNGVIQKFGDFEKPSKDSQQRILPKLEDNDGNIWFLVNTGQQTIVHRLTNGIDEVVLANGKPIIDRISILFKDREGFIWIGSPQGIRRLKTVFVQSISIEQGLSGKENYSILERKNGEIIVSAGEKLSVFENGKFVREIESKSPFNTLYEDNNENIWMNGVILSRSALTKTDSKTLTFLGKNSVRMFASDLNGNVWIGTDNGLFKTRDNKLIRKYTIDDGLQSNGVGYIHISKNGTLWLGTQLGISKFENDKFTNYSTKDGLAGNRIRTIYEDASGTIWIGTYGSGLSRFKDGKFFNYTSKDGLYHNGVFQIFEDDNENFWIGGNQGIYRVAKKDLNDFADGKIKRVNSFGYGKQDGMLNLEVNGGRQPAGIKASDGRLWFPTMDGVAIIDPKNIELNRNVPNALIEEVSINREQMEFQDGITVGVGKDNLEINYTAPSFIKPEQINFKYKLEGFNEDWIEVGTRRTAYYSYLPPGNYTFRLLVANSDGIWNDKETTINVKVLAPFYRTNWFFALVILSIIAIAFLLYRYRVGILERRNAQQMAFSQQLIALQEDERKRIAAGLHDSLGQHLIIIKNWATLALGIMDKKSPAREQINEISDTSLQALNEVREIINDLRPHQIETAGLTETIKTMLEQVESASGIKFKFEYDVIDHLLSKEDEVTFYRIIQEYVNNIVKHSDATNASVSIKNGSNTIKAKITDDGKGFDLSNNNKTKSGFGLTGIQERLKMLGGVQNIKSELGKETTIDIKIDLK